MMVVYGLSYVSKKNLRTSDEEIKKILKVSQRENPEKKITGLLIEYKSHFLQYLEGDPVIVYELFEKIKLDKRHDSIFLIKFDKIDSRIFENWNMLYKNFNETGDSAISVKSDLKVKLDDLLDKREFWKGVEVIEFLSNLK